MKRIATFGFALSPGVGDVLMKRRDKILRTYLPAINPRGHLSGQ